MGSFACITVHLEVAPFDPATEDASVHSVMSKKFPHMTIYEFNFPLGTKIAILAVAMWHLYV